MEINYEPNTIGYLDMTFGPKWDYIPLTRNYVENFLLVNLNDKKNISKIAMAASELLENAVKYSYKDGIRMKILKFEEQNSVVLFVYNYVQEEAANYVLHKISEMNKADPLQYYIGKMKESVSHVEGHAGLGLARINYEAEAEISANYFDDLGIIEVKALFKF